MVAVLFVYLLSLVCWLGGMVFFTALVAPIAFKALPMAEAGKLLSALFPRYYLLGYICGAIGSILAIFLCATRMPRMWWAMAALALAIALGLTVYAGAVVRPRGRRDSRRHRGGQSRPCAPRRIRPASSSVRDAQWRSDAAQPGGAARERRRAHSSG